MYVAELKRRRYRGKRPPEVTNPRQAFAVLKPRVQDWSREHFLVVLLASSEAYLRGQQGSYGASAYIVCTSQLYL